MPASTSVRHSHVTDPDAAFATLESVQDLADKVVGLHGAIDDHNANTQMLVEKALATMLEQLPAALEQATERAMRRVATDQALHKQIGASVLEQAAGNMHRKVGRFVINKWFALAMLVLVVAQAIGWPATLKALIGLIGGSKP